jgi:6-pyruvoyltetrahydropterin/6-carboxytetrahydropterin synthase
LHGHNYEVELLVEADALDDRGFVVDFAELDPVRTWIDATLDHRHLNDVMEGQPSAEAIARVVHGWCDANLRFRVAAVRVWETPRAYAEYRP